jgi:hypothetical protein
VGASASGRGHPAPPGAAAVDHRQPAGDLFMRSILLILLGVPLPVILLLAFCTHHF